MEPKYTEQIIERFKKYVSFDTQSSEESESFPSTMKQKKLGKVLAQELKTMGLQDVEMDEWGYVTATLPANTDKNVPVVGLISHMDTSPEVSGANVKPIIHKNYQGGDIQLPGDPTQIIRFENTPALKDQIGNDIITADGTTLLGADDKAGITEIFTAVQYLLDHPEIKHGKIRIAITPDEEVGRGTEHFDVKKFGADYAYTLDGETVGEIENETFCADSVVITIHGINMHPGYAKGKLVNAIKVGAEMIARLPKDELSPETTEGREGYVHPHAIQGGVETTTLKFLIRDFTVEGLHEKEEFLKGIADSVIKKFPGATMDFEVQESYRNMRYKLDEDPKVVEFALEAVKRTGLEPHLSIIRGGTDGSRLSYEGLLTPNIFTGGHNFHSKLEWVSIQDMEKTVETIINLVQVWEEKS
ncbi:MAG: peptidase T [Calditrichaeota bacterium]|nr:peptidase T [Calditrichota bacterium]